MPASFRGEWWYRLDRKGRISIPADFRRVICSWNADKSEDGDTQSITIVYGDSALEKLICYTDEGIRNIDAAIGKMQRHSNQREYLQYFFQTRSIRIQLDPNGRLLLPVQLRNKIDLQKEVCFVGKGDTFEIWHPQAYERYCVALEQRFADGSERAMLHDSINQFM